MQSNSSASDAAPAGALGGCGGEEDDNPSGAGSNLAALNLSLNCWLQILSKETSADLHGDSANTAVRVLIALVYLVVCVLGLVGNLLALFLLHFRRRGHRHTSVDCFVISLALTDLQFVLTLPFWAVDTVLDFRWPFGWVMCKIVSSVTTMNMYASVFFLTAMSVTRYHLLVTSQKIASPRRAAARAKWASLAIWAVSLVATLPHSIYSTTVQVSVDEELCLVRFSESDSGHLDPQVHPETARGRQRDRRCRRKPLRMPARSPLPPLQSHPLRHRRSSVFLHLLAAQPGSDAMGRADQVGPGAL